MDQIGQLELSWIQGYSGKSVGYITRDTVCFKCGNYIKFISEDGHENVFSVGEGIGPAAVHNYNKVFAVAEQTINPTIHVLAYPTFREVAQLQDGAKLEYTDLAFSSSLYLASVSGVPDFKLFLWNYTTGDRLASVDLPSSSPLTSIGFNPANWRELFMSTAEDIVIWQIEQSDDLYIMQQKSLGLPPVSGERHDISALSLHSRPTTSMTLELPKTSVAGVRGEDAKKFEKYKDAVEKVQPISHTWAPTGDLYVGCTGGQILKVGAEVYDVHFMYNPLNEAMRTESTSDTLHLGKQKSSMSIAAESTSSTMIVTPLGRGSVNCLLLHKEGLFAAGEEGTLRQLEVSNKGVHVKRSIPFGVAIKSLSFNPAYQKLALGSSQGCIFLYNLSESETFTTLVDTHHGAFIGVSPLCPGTDISVTVREDGELQAWRIDTGKLMSAIPLGCQATSVAASPLCHIAVVGTSDGHALFVDLNKLDKPKMIHRLHIHNGPVKHLKFNKNGRLLLSASNDGHVVITDGRPSKKFEPIGFTDVPGEIVGLSSYMDDQSGTTRVVVTAQRSDQSDPGASKLVHFNLPSDVADDPRKYHASLKYDLSSEAVEKLAFNFRHPSHGIAVTAAQYAFTLGHNDKQIHKLTLPQEPPKKENSKDSYIEPQNAVPAHGLPGGQLQMSPHQKWLASVCADGRLSVRALGSLNKSVDVIAHSYAEGGVRSVAFTSDAQSLLTTGHDGTVACFKWNFSTSGAAKGQSAIESQRVFQETLRQDGQLQDDSAMLMPEWTPPPPSSRPGSATQKEEQEKMEKQKALENDQIYTTPTPVPSADATWLEIKEAEAIIEEDKKYASLKKDLRTEIRDMRRKIQAMMKDNEVVQDIERLGREEFDLDIEEQLRLQAAGDSHVEKIREEKEFDNLRKMYLADLIRRECWDEMMVKGRGIGAFNSNLEVHNYPMKKRSREELDRLEYITKQCKLQAEELKARRELTEAHSKPSAAAIDDDDHDENDDGESSEGKEQPSTTGSLGAQYGGQNELFYSQFDLHTREQKIRQIILLEDAIYRIRMEFNKEFDDVYQRKEQEIAKIKDKNRRIRKIIEDLDLVMDVFEPELGPLEKPEMLLKVEDKEVKVERYLTAEQKKQLEKEQKEEEERRLREKGDNVRERALDMMMGGVLEVKKEDELKKDVPIPAFMQNKPEEEWSEDEKKLVQEYEKKVKELQEEREKYRKQLEAELKKLQAQIQEGTLLYDEVLMGLHGRKIKTEMVIYQEELKILRLKYSLLIEEELNNRESELIDLLEFKKEMKNLAAEAAAESKKQVDAFRDAYENLDAHERVMDREFKRKFIDVPAVQVEQLNKLFRKRPRGQRGHIRAADSTPLFDAASSGNPFSERPSTAKKEEHAMSALEAALVEMDKEINMPEGVEPPVWERLCKFRREKIEKENLVKQKAQVLASMQEFLKHRQDEFETLKTEVEDLTIAITKLQEERMRFSCNLEVQLLLKQGQVEVDSGSFIHDYKISLLIHRSVVEDLNGRIKQLGESKISSMVESKDFRKGIIQLEWEHKKMTMEMEDLKNKQRDIQNLKVTREIQAFLNEEDHDAKKAQEIQILEQTIQTQKLHHEKNVRERQRTLKELKKVIHDRSQENTRLGQDLQDLNVSVNERRHIHEVNADKRSDVGQEKRYQEIVQRRKLVDLAKAQAQEVAVLRAEVERLRMRTFPALVQVEH